MNEIIKIKCPGCGSILKIQNQPDLDKKYVPCPTCKLKSRFADCQRIADEDDADKTQVNHNQTGGKKEEDTILNQDIVASAGRLINTQNGDVHHLRLGKNTIGRCISNPLPSVSIPIVESQTHNSMSREHAIIVVTRLESGSYRCFLSNWKAKNGTWVDGMPLAEGDSVVLNHGQTIRMGKVLLRYETEKEKRTNS